MIKHKYHNTK